MDSLRWIHSALHEGQTSQMLDSSAKSRSLANAMCRRAISRAHGQLFASVADHLWADLIAFETPIS